MCSLFIYVNMTKCSFACLWCSRSVLGLSLIIFGGAHLLGILRVDHDAEEKGIDATEHAQILGAKFHQFRLDPSLKLSSDGFTFHVSFHGVFQWFSAPLWVHALNLVQW